MLQVYEKNSTLDPEALELRLDHAVLEEADRLDRFMWLVRVVSVVAPLMGLLGTVTGMIEVFDVMAGGGGNARGMAAGVSKATLPTMAGMVASISGMLVIVQIKRYAKDEAELLADNIQMKRD